MDFSTYPTTNAIEIEIIHAIGLVLFLFVVMAFSFAIKIRRLHKRLEVAEDNAHNLYEILSCCSDGYYAWIYPPIATWIMGDSTDFYNARTETIKEECSRSLAVMLGLISGINSSFKQIAEKLEDEDRRLLIKNVDELRHTGIGFTDTFNLRNNGRIIKIKGSRAVNTNGRILSDILWIRDVTEEFDRINLLEYQLEETKQSGEMAEILMNTIPFPLWLRGDDFSPILCNDAYAKIVEANSPQDVVARGLELAQGTDAQNLRAMASRARRSKEKQSSRIHIIANGNRHLFDISEIYINLSQNKNELKSNSIFTAGIAIDVTEIEEIENTVQFDKKERDEILGNLSAAIAGFNEETRISFFNNSFIKMWNIDKDWLDSRPFYGDFLDFLRERRMISEVPDFKVFKNNEIKNFTSLIKPIEDILHLPEGKTLRRLVTPNNVSGFMIIYEDITMQFAIERAYKTLIAVQKETLDNLNEAVAVFGSDGKLKYSNKAYSNLWDTEKYLIKNPNPHINEIIEWQKPYFEDVDDWPDFQDKILQSITNRLIKDINFVRSDGIVLQSKSVALPDGGILITYFDVTDRALIEKNLQEHNDVMMAASRMRNRFLSSVMGEIKQPIQNLADYSEILEADYEKSLKEPQAEYVRGIMEAAETLKERVENIVDIASIEAGQMPLELNTFDINNMLDGLTAMIKEKIRRRKINFDFKCPKNIGWIVGDERKIKQVLFYLLGNAVSATPSGGKVDFYVDKHEAENNQEENQIIFIISDSGMGINAKNKNDSEESNLDGWYEKGSLGDALVKRLIEMHQGNIETIYDAGKGSTVIVKLPDGSS